MKRLMILALAATLATATVQPVFAQDNGKCKKECPKNCPDKGKGDCKKGDKSCCKDHPKA